MAENTHDFERLRAAFLRLDLFGDRVYGYGWNSYRTLRQHLKAADLASSRWLNYRRDMTTKKYGVMEPDFWNESTFDKCVEWEFNVKELLLKITMWDGDFYGERTTRRCEWIFQLTVHDTALYEAAHISRKMLNEIASAADDEYQRELDEARAKAISAIMNKMLDGTWQKK